MSEFALDFLRTLAIGVPIAAVLIHQLEKLRHPTLTDAERWGDTLSFFVPAEVIILALLGLVLGMKFV